MFLRLRTKQECLILPLLFIIVVEVLVTVIRPEKEIKVVQIGESEINLSLFAEDMVAYV